jgi:hypothetical protein
MLADIPYIAIEWQVCTKRCQVISAQPYKLGQVLLGTLFRSGRELDNLSH